VQLEINRALYLDETSLAPTASFSHFAADIDGLVSRITAMGQGWVAPPRRQQAAE
jgi:N-formylglutamate amidohydrolase